VHIYEACFHGCEHPVCARYIRARGKQGDGEETTGGSRGGGEEGSPRRTASRATPFIYFTPPDDGRRELVCRRARRADARSLARAVYTLRWRVRAMRKAQILLVAVMNDNGRPLIPAKHGGMPAATVRRFFRASETRGTRARARLRTPYPGNYGTAIAPRG